MAHDTQGGPDGATPREQRGVSDLRLLMLVQCSIAGYLLLLVFFFPPILGGREIPPAFSILCFLAAASGAGFVGGLQFPLAMHLFLKGNERGFLCPVGERAGILYGADLFGSCLGAFLAAAVMVPLMGVPHTALASAGLVALSAMLLWPLAGKRR